MAQKRTLTRNENWFSLSESPSIMTGRLERVGDFARWSKIFRGRARRRAPREEVGRSSRSREHGETRLIIAAAFPVVKVSKPVSRAGETYRFRAIAVSISARSAPLLAIGCHFFLEIATIMIQRMLHLVNLVVCICVFWFWRQGN